MGAAPRHGRSRRTSAPSRWLAALATVTLALGLVPATVGVATATPAATAPATEAAAADQSTTAATSPSPAVANAPTVPTAEDPTSEGPTSDAPTPEPHATDDAATDAPATDAPEDGADEEPTAAAPASRLAATPDARLDEQLITPLAAGGTVPPFCTAGYVYSLSSNGQIRQSLNGTITTVGSAVANAENFNGLGIGAGGDAVYAFRRSGWFEDVATIWRFTPSTGTWASTGNSLTTKLGNPLLAGAVDLDTGMFMFGGFNNAGTEFRIWQYNPTTGAFTPKGYTATTLNASEDSNSDMAFDAAGNLFIVRGVGTSVTIFSITKAALSAANGGSIVSSVSSTFTAISGVNGLAFGDDGRAYLGAASAITSYAMPSWTDPVPVTPNLGGSSTDLASCTSPPTIAVQKIVNGRTTAGDQFALTLAQGATTVGSTTTTGSANGLQPQQVGPLPTARGAVLTFSEALVGTGTLAAGYTSSYTCTSTYNGVTTTIVPVTSGTSGTVTIPSTGSPAVVCTITNTGRARLTLIKQVTNDSGGTALPAAWTLTAAGPTTLTGATGSTAVTNVVVPVGTYALSETGPGGYTASSWTCTGATGFTASSVTLAPGDNVARCTIVNNDQPATLTLVKQVTNDNGGTALPSAWTLSASGPTPISGATGSSAVTNATVSAGTYTLSETGPSGYAAAAWTCTAGTLTGSSLVLPNGVSATCTIVNNDQPATLTLVKNVTNDNGGLALPSAWTLRATGPTTITGTTGSSAVTGATVNAGTYVLSEMNGPAGYSAGAWSCTAGTLTGSSLVLPNGVSATCTIVNNDQPATLTLVKQVTNDNGGTAAPSAWTLRATGPTTITGATGTTAVTNAVVNAGTYALSESGGPAGYSAGAWSCTAGTLTGSSLVLANGVSATCTIVNNDQPATLTLVKQVTNDNGGTATPTAWTLSATGPTTITGATGTTAVTNAVVNAGTYALSESGGPAGYSAGAWSCTAGTLTGSSLVLANGVSATCTIVNNDQPSTLTLVKQVTNDNGGTAVATAWTLRATGPTTITGTTGSTAVTNATVNAGTYALSESGGPAGYSAGAWSCTAGTVSGSSLVLPNGVSATCTIVNNDQPATLTLVKQVTNDNGGTALPTAWTLTATGPTTITGTTGAGTVTAAPVNAGTYALSESGGPAGYSAGAWSCTAGTLTGSSLVLPNGVSATCTIVNNDQPATLTLVKTVINNNGGTALPTAWTLSATGPTTITGATGTTAVTNATVNAGTYALAESGGPGGYTPTSWTCTAGTLTGSSLVLPNGVSATCTITNDDQPARLTLRKVVDANESGSGRLPADWTLTATPSGITGQGPVTGNGDPSSAGGVSQVVVFAGSYDLTEAGPVGFTPGDWICTGGVTPDADTVTVPNGGNVECTITNTAVVPTLTLVKVVDNGDTGATSVATDWTLSATGASSVSGATGAPSVTDAPVQVGTYLLAESGPAGYDALDWVCTGATATTGTTVTLAEGDDVTCTITNTAQQPTLTLVKVVDNGDTGATSVATDWTLTADGPTALAGASGSEDVTSVDVQVGDYTLTETGPAGYDASDWVCTGGTNPTADGVTVALGQDVTCTITNTAQQPTLTLVKVVDNGDTGATAEATDWTLTADGPTALEGASGSEEVTAAPVQIGDYALAETGPDGYDASDWVCTGGTDPTADGVTVALGQDVTCTITNTAQQPTLTLVKVVDNGDTGATAEATDWTLTADGPTALEGASGAAEVTAVPVQIGDYTLAETGPAGYDASDWVCTGAASSTATGVSVGLGENVTCTITNTAQQPTLTLVKVVDNGDTGATAEVTDWTLTATGPSTVQGATGSAAVTTARVEVGAYALTETGPAGYDASDWVCTGAASSTPTGVSVALGENVTCTITNTAQQPTLTLVKVVDNGDTGATAEATDWTLTADGPTALEGASGAAEVTAVPVQIGDYALTESGPEGYDASDWVCTGSASSTATGVSVALGENATCTITNTAQQPTLTLVKVVDNGETGATAEAADWTLTATGPSTIQGATGSAAVTAGQVEVGAYALSETGPAGYDASDWVCTGGTDPTADGVTIALGQDVTCTITNTAQQPMLTLVKVVDNGETGATAEPTDWTLTADGPTALEGASGAAEVTAVPVQIGDYALAESGPEGYEASDWVCTGSASSTPTGVSVALGENVTCTITNTAQQPTLTLVKVVDNGDTGATAEATDWTLTADGPTALAGASGSEEVTGVPVPIGDYTFTESGPEGYDASDWVCTGGTNPTADGVTVALGQDVTCTITNTAIAPLLTLVKQVVNDQGGTATPEDWTLSATGPTTIAGATGAPEVTNAVVQVGEYALTETGGPGGFTPSDWTCVDAAGGGVEAPAGAVSLAVGDDVTCTIVNDDQAGLLTLRKVVDENESGSGKLPADWTLTATPSGIEGQAPVSGNGDPTSDGGVSEVTVFAGSYALTESGPIGFDAGDWVCTGGVLEGSTVVVPNGGNVECFITNTAVVPTLTLVKVVDNGETGATSVATDWTLTADGPSPVSGETGDASITDAPVRVGTYTLSESGPEGYDASEWVCTGATSSTPTSVTLAEGENAECTLTNTAVPPTLTLVKVVDNGESGRTSEATDWTLTAAGPTTIEGATGAPEVTDAVVRVGDYDLTESGPAGYDASTWTCEGGAGVSDGAVTLALGQDITCTITNTARPTGWTITKSSDPTTGSTVVPGDVITYTLTVLPEANAYVEGVRLVDDLSGVLDNATLETTELAPSQGTASVTGETLTWDVGTLNGGDPLTLTYAVRVNDGAFGVRIGNVVTGTGEFPAPPCETDCSTTHVTPAWSLAKTSDPATGSTVDPGQSVTYTLEVTNTSEAVVSGAVVTDDLSGVLAHASLGAIGAGGSVTGTTLTWTVPTLQPGEVATLSYTVTVDADAVGVTLANVATPSSPGGTCVAEDGCATSHPTPGWTIAKSSDPASGSTVLPGQSVTYTLTATNVSDGVVSGRTAVDDLGDVLDDATLTEPLAQGLTFDPATGVLTWAIPDLAPGSEPATVSYTVTVNDGAYGTTLRNVVTSPGSSPCVAPEGRRVLPRAASDGVCTTTTEHYTPAWTLAKSSDPVSGSSVDPGGRVTYTLTATNTSDAEVSGATAVDDLSKVLSGAELVGTLPDGLTLSGSTLTWAIPTMAAGSAPVSVSYTVQVSQAGGVTITNVVSPQGGGGECVGSCSTTHDVPPPPAPPAPEPLPGTGAAVGVAAGIALVLLLGGGGAVVVSRRRRDGAE